MAGLRYPSHGRLRQTEVRPSAEGRSNWLNFLRKTLAVSIQTGFIPAHPDPFDFFTLNNFGNVAFSMPLGDRKWRELLRERLECRDNL